MRFLQAEPDLPLAEQSAAATRRGVPWWGAVAIAFGFALLGIAIDSATARLFGLPEGIHARQIFFVLGCLLAVLAVRNRALFTAAVQPPLIAIGLVIARVIGVQLKGLVTSANVPELSSLLIKQVFAFSNDFPVILFTFLAVLTVALARWWRYRQARSAQAPEAKAKDAAGTTAKAKTAAAKQGGAKQGGAQQPAAPKPESAAVRASRAAAAAQANPQAPSQPPGRVRPGGEAPFRAGPAVVPSGRGRPPAGRPGESAVRPRPDRMTAGAMSRDRSGQQGGAPAVRPSRPAGPPVAAPPPPQPGRRRAAPPPLDDEGF